MKETILSMVSVSVKKPRKKNRILLYPKLYSFLMLPVLLLGNYFSVLTTEIPYPNRYEDECLLLLRKIYNKLRTPTVATDANHIYYLDYRIKTILRDSLNTSPYAARVKVYMNNQHVRLLSEEMSVYQDQTHSFTVLPDRKVIYWGDSSLNLAREIRTKSLNSLQDTLFSLALVRECKNIRLPNGKANKEVVLDLDEQAQKLFPYERLTFQIDTVLQTIHKVVCDYPPPNKIARIEITFIEINYDYKTDLLDKPVMSLFFNEKQQLLPEYKDYKLINQRRRGEK